MPIASFSGARFVSRCSSRSFGPKGQLLAGECEAHDGLHLEAPGLRIDAQLVDMSLCPCGRKTPRFGVQPRISVMKGAAASAG